MEIHPPEQEERTFATLPLDLQRTMIEYCVANKQFTMQMNGIVYELPSIIQFTFRCSNKSCSEVESVRFFRQTVITGNIRPTRKCRECGGNMYISHKTASLDYYLGPKRKEELIGLMKFLAPIMEEEQETYGPPPIDDPDL